MRHRNFIAIDWITMIVRLILRVCIVANQLMSIEIIVDPFSFFAAASFLTFEEAPIKVNRFLNIIGGDCEVKWRDFNGFSHMNMNIISKHL